MGIRRRRRKLTSLMSRLEQRVKSVELRSTNLLTDSQVQALLPTGPDDSSPTSIVSSAAPAQFRKVQDAYLYPKKFTGFAADRVEIYLESDLELSNNEKIEVSGIHGASNLAIDVSGIFTVSNTDTPPWTNRTVNKKPKHDPSQSQLPGVTITNTYSFIPETQAPGTYSAATRLTTKQIISSYAISGTTVTITTGQNHLFKAGDVLFFDIFSSDPRAFGVDGLFKVTSVTSNTIVYTLDAGVVTPVPATPPTSASYVYPVAREYLPVGSTWADSSNNKIYYWDGIRWVDYSTVADPIRDGDPPAPPTNLQVTSTPEVHGPTFNSYSKVVLTWTAPTLTSQGDPLTDLIGYVIKWRTSPTADWDDHFLPTTSASTFTFGPQFDLEQGKTYYFELYARDSGSQDSTAATATHTTQLKTGDHTTYPPTAPVATSRLGTITVTWDGKLKTGPSSTIAAPRDIVVMNIYVSTTIGFTPSESNLLLKTRVFGPEGGFDVLTDLQYNTSYYIRISLVNTSGVEGSFSEQVTAQVTPLVNTDIIYSTLNTWPFVDGTVSANALADGSVIASKILGGAVTASALAANAVTSVALAANAVTAAAIAANAVTGPAISSSAITANKISAGAVTAVSIAAGAITSEKITAGAIGAQQIAADAITADKISAGAIGADEIAAGAIIAGKIGADAVTAATISAGAITAGKIATNAVEADKINAGAITAVKIATDAITADKIQAGAIFADKIAADAISTYVFNGREIRLSATNNNLNPKISLTKDRIAAFKSNNTTSFRLTAAGDFYADDVFIDSANVTGNITGGTIRTASSGKRVVMSGSTNEIEFYGTSGTEVGSVGGAGTTILYQGGTGHSFHVPAGTAVFTIFSSGITLGTGRNINSTGNITGATLTTTGAISSGASITSDFNITASNRFNQTSFTALTGTTTAVHRLNSTGFFTPSGSDARLKENIEEIENGLDLINNLRPVKYTYISEAESPIINYGLIAQEVRPFVEENSNIVNGQETEDEYLSLEYIQFIAPLIAAVKELSAKNEALEARLAALEGN